MKIGIQLYSVRNYTKTLEELDSTLAKLSACGYKYVETAGYYGMSAGELAKLLQKHGIQAVSTHTGIEAVSGDLGRVIEDHKALGATHCAIPGLPGRFYHGTEYGFGAAAEVMNLAAQRLAEHGISLSYHNHTHEFLPVGNSCGYDIIFKTAPELNMQIDVGHANVAGEKPEEWIKRYKNRIKTIHYKDAKVVDNQRRDYPIGEGGVDFAAVTAALLDSTCEYIIVEIEDFFRDPFEVCETSYKNIESFLAAAK